MRKTSVVRRLLVFSIFSSWLLSASCRGRGSEFVGKWQNIKDAGDTLEITRNGDQFLIISKSEKIPASYKDGTLEVSAIVGTVRVAYIHATDTLAMPKFAGGAEYKRLNARAAASAAGRLEQQRRPRADEPLSPATEIQRQKTTLANVRALATAIEAYAVDHNTYVSASCAQGLFTAVGQQLTASSFTSLTPTYIAQPPLTDGWERFMYYNRPPNADSYNIISHGRDGKPDAQGVRCGTTTDFNDDIVYSNGTFIQWPEGAQQ